MMSDFELPTGIGATMRTILGTYVRVGEDEWMCTKHVLDALLGPDTSTFTNEEMMDYPEWEVVSEGVEL